MAHNSGVEVRITRSARKHKIGNARILHALANHHHVEAVDDDGYLYIGTDDRGVELEIVLVPDDRHEYGWAVIHAMPTAFKE